LPKLYGCQVGLLNCWSCSNKRRERISRSIPNHPPTAPMMGAACLSVSFISCWSVRVQRMQASFQTRVPIATDDHACQAWVYLKKLMVICDAESNFKQKKIESSRMRPVGSDTVSGTQRSSLFLHAKSSSIY
jgi:hypothetical protein